MRKILKTLFGRGLFLILILSILALMAVVGQWYGVNPAMPAYATCRGTYWVEVRENGSNYYGVKGNNIVQIVDPATGNENDVWLNSIGINDPSDYLSSMEIGVNWASGWPKPRVFVVTLVDGVYNEYQYHQVEPRSAHSYEVRVVSGDTWGFYVDGQLLRTVYGGFHQGKAFAQQERHYACNALDVTSWYALKKANSALVWSNWSSMVLGYDNDPDYCAWKPSNTSFYTQRKGDPDCNLSN